MHEHVPEVLVRTRERHHDAVAQRFGEPAGGAVDDLRQRVRLREVVVRAVDDDRDAPGQGVPEALREHGVGLFGQVQRAQRKAVRTVVVVDLEVVRRDRAPAVLLVLDLVLAEVLRPRRRRLPRAEQREQREDRRNPQPHPGVLSSPAGAPPVAPSLQTTPHAPSPFLPSVLPARLQVHVEVGHVALHRRRGADPALHQFGRRVDEAVDAVLHLNVPVQV